MNINKGNQPIYVFYKWGRMWVGKVQNESRRKKRNSRVEKYIMFVHLGEWKLNKNVKRATIEIDGKTINHGSRLFSSFFTKRFGN